MLLGKVEKSAAESCHAIWTEVQRQLGDDFEQLFSHIWTMCGRPKGKLSVREQTASADQAVKAPAAKAS